MDNRGGLGRVIAGALAASALFAGSLLAQDGVTAPGPPAPGNCPAPPSQCICGDQSWALESEVSDGFFITLPRSAFYFRAEGGAMQRRPDHTVDFQSFNMSLPTGGSANNPTAIVLSTGDLTFDFAVAGQFLVGHKLTDCIAIEGVYTGVTSAYSSETVRDPTLNPLGGAGNLFSPFHQFGEFGPFWGLDYNHSAAINYTTTLQSAELNLRRQLPAVSWEGLMGTMSILFGVRYISQPEHLAYLTTSDVTTSGSVVSNGAVNDIRVDTSNDMIGPQIGALFEVYDNSGWAVNFEMKAALLNDQCQETSTYVNLNNGRTSVYPSAVAGHHTSFAGELNLTCVYRWSPHFMTRLGYHALWLTNLATAPDNFNTDIFAYTSMSTLLTNNASALYHGPFAGIEVGW